MADADLMEKIVSLCKRRGFVFPGSEIYGGLAGTYDLGHLGSELAHNIKESWWNHFVRNRDDMYGLTSSVLMPEPVWRASGHLAGFSDPMVECKKCRHRFRSDQLENLSACPDCGGALGEEKVFNLLFPVETGSTASGTNRAYLRGEIAQGMFVNFKNTIDAYHPKLPFGIAQIGKAFRNEIAPRDFLFRAREFDLMEFEYFIRESEWEEAFEMWRNEMWSWMDAIGIPREKVRELEVPDGERAFYSKRTIDFEFEYPFGRKELWGLAYRTDYDLARHAKHSGVDLSYLDDEKGERFIPHVIEPTFGLGRTLLAILASAYREDEMNGEVRAYLALAPSIAPVKAMVSPLLKNKPELVAKAREVRAELKKAHPAIAWDDNGNIGKRYRRQDEIGTKVAFTIDFQTLDDDSITMRDRDTGTQIRIRADEAASTLARVIEGEDFFS